MYDEITVLLHNLSQNYMQRLILFICKKKVLFNQEHLVKISIKVNYTINKALLIGFK